MRSVNNTIRAASQSNGKHRILKVPTKNKHHITLAPINRFIQIKDCAEKDCQYKLGKLIGSGSNAQVYQAMNMNTGEVVACKKVLFKFKNQQKVDIELSFLQILQHQNIIKYISHVQTKDSLLIYQEYMPMGSISQLLNEFGPMTEQTIKTYTHQILNGLEYLHNKGILHLDLKSSNILLDSSGDIKISDFGCSRHIKQNLCQSILQGSVPWMAPEVVRQEQIDTPADIWSFGCVILEMLTGKHPWFEQLDFDNVASTLLAIAFNQESPKIPDNVSKELTNFLLMCFSQDPLQRATIQQLRQSAFLQ
ncbi:unnamed protein product [Paramecium pentaurelia]|uniref:Protein kinase domain-containing protein n=1 Tax=Paramecium pentaurelia TaxID=43138 RepID=A0A8S1VLL2_9CILI|nr:unnamed protein product [Paramecium pentaurelia]